MSETDPIGQVLQSLRLQGGVFLDARFTAPWCIQSRITAKDCGPFMSASGPVIGYHYVMKGRLVAQVEDEPPIEARAGEIIMIPRDGIHLLASGPGLQPVDAQRLVEPAVAGGLAHIAHGGGGEVTELVCGFLGSEDVFAPLMATLPRVLTYDVGQGAQRAWVEASMRFAVGERTESGAAAAGLLARVSEVLLVEALRHHLRGPAAPGTGLLKGLGDPQIGKALALIHGDCAREWTVEVLAREAALSRSAFVQRFAREVGHPPIRYLAQWRLHCARRLLRQSAKTIAQVAHEVGYESQEAFSRAFKREFGRSPGQWRENPSAP